MLIRDATPDDARAIAQVVTRSWKVAYRGIFTDERLDGLDVDAAAARWHATLTSGAEGRTVLVAERDGTVIGMIESIAPTDVDPDAEIRMLYLEPDVRGAGVGRALQAAMLERLRGDGLDRVVLWCEPRNVAARAFYERTGWTDDRIEKTETWANRWVVNATRYSRSL